MPEYNLYHLGAALNRAGLRLLPPENIPDGDYPEPGQVAYLQRAPQAYCDCFAVMYGNIIVAANGYSACQELCIRLDAAGYHGYTVVNWQDAVCTENGIEAFYILQRQWKFIAHRLNTDSLKRLSFFLRRKRLYWKICLWIKSNYDTARKRQDEAL